MADYYPLIARAVAGLDHNAGDSRRALYERARTALIAQLRSVEPALSESEITRERLALEEAIRKVEQEAAQRARADAAKPKAPPPPPPAPPPPRSSAGDALRGPVRTGNAAPPRERAVPPPREERMPPRPSRDDPFQPVPRSAAQRPTLSEQGARGFRDVVADADELGRAAAQANRSARKAYSEVPSPSPEFDRLEPDMEWRGADPSMARGGDRGMARGADHGPARGPASDGGAPRGRPTPPDAKRASKGKKASGGMLGKVVKVLGALVGVVILALLVVFLWKPVSTKIAKLLKSTPQTKVETPRDTTPANNSKISDRLGQPGSADIAPVAQRAVLYEEDPGEPQGKQTLGSVVWRLDMSPAGPGKPAEPTVRADIEFPDRKVKISLSVRRNNDTSLPASHTAELTFALPTDFSGGAVANVPGILMKSAEQTRGTPLAGLAVKVTDGFFLIGLSSVEADKARNIQMLKDRPWFDIPIVYTNQRRAILAVEKGAPGERVFNEAFAAWGQ